VLIVDAALRAATSCVAACHFLCVLRAIGRIGHIGLPPDLPAAQRGADKPVSCTSYIAAAQKRSALLFQL
jgi:hypothetical protein